VSQISLRRFAFLLGLFSVMGIVSASPIIDGFEAAPPAVLSGSLPPTCTNCYQRVYVNGTFDTTGSDSWLVYAGSIDIVANTYWQAAQGTRSIDLIGEAIDSAPDNGWIGKRFTTVAGQTYSVTFDYSGNPEFIGPGGPNPTNPAIKTFNVGVMDGAKPIGTNIIYYASQGYSFDASAVTRSAMGYQIGTFIFTAVGTDTTLFFQSTLTGVDQADLRFGAVIDNIVFDSTGVPEPGTLAMMAAGLAAIGMARKRRR
jgi:hypothetical protein